MRPGPPLLCVAVRVPSAVRQRAATAALAALLGLPAAGGAWSAAPAQAAYPGQDGRILYQVDSTAAKGVIYMRAAAGGAPQGVHAAPGARGATFSPQGRRIAFAAGGDIWVMQADGSGATRLTDDPEPDLSPDWQPVPTCTIRGTGSSDADLRGTDGDDVICALAGDDVVHGGGGSDLIFGGKGADTLDGQDGNDVLVGEQDDDVLEGGPGYDVIDGGPGTDRCVRGADGALRRLCES
jgi:hypothetical protein